MMCFTINGFIWSPVLLQLGEKFLQEKEFHQQGITKLLNFLAALTILQNILGEHILNSPFFLPGEGGSERTGYSKTN